MYSKYHNLFQHTTNIANDLFYIPENSKIHVVPLQIIGELQIYL